MHPYGALGDAQQGGNLRTALGGRLAGGPQFELAVLVMRQAVGGLHLRMRKEREGIPALHHLGGGLHGFFGIAIAAQHQRGRLLEQLIGALLVPGARFFACLALIPGHFQLFPGRVGLPKAIGDHRDSAVQTPQNLGPFEDKSMPDARQCPDFVKIGVDGLAREHRTFLIHRPQHSRHGHVAAENRLAGDHVGNTHAAGRRADDGVILGVLESDLREVRRSQRRRFGRQRAVGRGAVGPLVDDLTRCGGKLRFGNVPGFGCGGDEHGAAGCTDSSQRNPIIGRRGASSGALLPVFRLVEIGLHHLHIFPIHVQLIGNEHGQ